MSLRGYINDYQIGGNNDYPEFLKWYGKVDGDGCIEETTLTYDTIKYWRFIYDFNEYALDVISKRIPYITKGLIENKDVEFLSPGDKQKYKIRFNLGFDQEIFKEVEVITKSLYFREDIIIEAF